MKIGCGKSALLANWAKLELEKDPSEQSTIIFQHFAGATYDSVKVFEFYVNGEES